MTSKEAKYVASLLAEDRKKYLDKLKLTNGSQLPDPLLLNNGWHQDMEKMPPIKWWDISNYVMKTPSPYTQSAIENLKANEAHDFFANGHVQDVYMNNIDDTSQFSFIKSEVCIGMIDMLGGIIHYYLKKYFYLHDAVVIVLMRNFWFSASCFGCKKAFSYSENFSNRLIPMFNIFFK